MKLSLLAASLLVALALGATTATAQSEATVEVRVWQGVSNASNLHISARPAGGSWRTLGTTRLNMSGLSSRGTFTYGDITVAVPLSGARAPSQVNVEVRVWQSLSNALDLYISARPEGGSWGTLGTIPLDMSGLNSRGTFRYGDIEVAVPLAFLGRGNTNETRFDAHHLDDGSLFTTIVVWDAEGEALEGGDSAFGFRCLRGILETTFVVTGSREVDHRTLVEHSVDDQEPVTERWRVTYGVIGDYFFAPDPEALLERLRGARMLQIRLVDERGFVRLNDDGDIRVYPHDVSSLLTTPAQINIERCGDEGWR